MKPDISRLVEFVSEKTGRNFDFAPAYAEPGYSDPEAGIVFGNWNPVCGFNVPKETQRRDPVKKLARILEKLGFELEWEDEWDRCSDCGKAVRTQPDCYHWTSAFRILNDCELVCLECLSKDIPGYLESIEDNPQQACPPEFHPSEHGYTKHNGTFETGFHPGQDANPKEILKALHAENKRHVVFRIDSKGQFDLDWEAYYKS